MNATVLATALQRPDAAVLAEVADVLARGGLAVVPTETVYGLAARVDRPEAAARLSAAKARDAGKPLQVLVGAPDEARGLAGEWSALSARLAAELWPGGLTLVVPAADTAPTAVVAGDGSVGLRCPDHPALRELLRLTGPLAASSANLSGEPPATTCEAALQALGAAVDVALDTGPALGGVASTVVRVVGDTYQVLRPGTLTAGQLAAACGGQGKEAADER